MVGGFWTAFPLLGSQRVRMYVPRVHAWMRPPLDELPVHVWARCEHLWARCLAPGYIGSALKVFCHFPLPVITQLSEAPSNTLMTL